MSLTIRTSGKQMTIMHKRFKRRCRLPYRNVSFINVLCALRFTFGISFTHRYEKAYCQGECCTRYIAIVNGAELCSCNPGTWEEQESMAVQSLLLLVEEMLDLGLVVPKRKKTGKGKKLSRPPK